MTHTQHLVDGVMQGLGFALAPLAAFGIYVWTCRCIQKAAIRDAIESPPAAIEQMQPVGFHKPDGV